MRILLDTHALLWGVIDDKRLSKEAARIMTASDITIYVSAATAWEVAIKVSLGKLPEARSFLGAFESELRIMGYASLPVSVSHALQAGILPRHHGDPFDRMIIAQSLAEDLPVLSNDSVFDKYGAARIW